ncbi:MAG TPA: hypothetical protein VF988_03720, partial [Verrucomicrobiae bacterium]
MLLTKFFMPLCIQRPDRHRRRRVSNDNLEIMATAVKLFSKGGYLAVLALVFCGMPVHAADTVKVLAQSDSEVTIALPDGQLNLRPLTANALRVRISDGKSIESPSLVLTEKVPAPKFTVDTSRRSISICTAKMKVTVDRQNGVLSFSDAKGNVFLAEETGGRVVKPSSIQGEPTFAVEQAFVSPPDERLFGSGEFQDGQLNLRGLPRRLTQVNTEIAMPFFLSSKGYGLLWHNYGLTELNPADDKITLVAGETKGAATTVEVTTTEGTKKETRKPGEFVGAFTVTNSGGYAFLLDIGQKMARRWHVEVDGKVVVDFNNFWLPPTTSWRMDLAAGRHSIKVNGEKNDQPAVFFG